MPVFLFFTTNRIVGGINLALVVKIEKDLDQ